MRRSLEGSMGKRLRWRWVTAVSVAIVLTTSAGADESSWGRMMTPSSPPARALGGHARGCLGGAEPLPLDGLGYQVMRPSRNRFFGHPVAVEFVRELAEAMRLTGHDDLLIGDLAKPRGGPILHGHRSHQTGLDIDIWFLAASRTLSAQEREVMSAISMVAGQGTQLDVAVWTGEQVELLRTAAAFPQVDRIFVNAAIKQELCLTVNDDRSWLAKLRPWWGHDDHFHVGLRCPEDEIGCFDRPPVPAGDGCDETLTWWFSEEAAEELRKLRATPPRPLTLDDLPPACRAVLADGGEEFSPAGAEGW
jgi:penicillin-insensitive murein DD-endopeptidase